MRLAPCAPKGRHSEFSRTFKRQKRSLNSGIFARTKSISVIKACIFDLDGVIVDTAHYHFLAWKRLADELGVAFTETENERLKGVSRMDSLDIILELGHIKLDTKTKEALANKKNVWFVYYVNTMKANEIF